MPEWVRVVYALVLGVVAVGAARITQWITRDVSLFNWASVTVLLVVALIGGWKAEWVLQLHRDAFAQLRRNITRTRDERQ